MNAASKAEEIKAKAERMKAAAAKREAATAGTSGAQAPTEVATDDDKTRALAPGANAPHVKPIRSTVDLSPVRHNQLKTWCAESAVELGRARVTTQDVVRAMVARLLTDETFARKIRDDLHNDVR